MSKSHTDDDSGADSGRQIRQRARREPLGERLPDKVCVVTGGARGQGRAAAQLFGAHGARVVVADIDGDGAEETAQLLRATGHEASARQTDVADESSVRELMSSAVESFGRIDVLYNNAAIWSGGNIDNHVTELETENWDRIIDVNLKSVYLCSKYAVPTMIENGSGSVINIASAAGIVGSRGRSHAYSASKGAIVALTRTMAMAYAKRGVRVNAICPGGVDTPMIASMTNTAERAERFAASHPIGRMGTPEDIAYCGLYLASDESSWVTGTIFPVDGGYTAQ